VGLFIFDLSYLDHTITDWGVLPTTKLSNHYFMRH